MGLEGSVFIGIFAGIANVIPYFGPVIGMIPAFLMGLCTDGFWSGALAVIILLVIQQIDCNFIYPKIEMCIRDRLRLAFASAPMLQHLNLAAYHNSLARSTKSTWSLALPLLVSIRFQVLFHSPPGVLFTFPSRYFPLSVTG